MRRLLTLLALAAALALPLLTPAPASAGDGGCPAEYSSVLISQIQQNDPRPGAARHAAAADVNHNGLVCVQHRGNQGVVYEDDIP